MKWRFLLLTGFLLLAYWGGNYLHKRGSSPDAAEEASQQLSDFKPAPDFETGSGPKLAPEGIAEAPTLDSFEPPDGLAKPNELALSFNNPASYRNFLDRLEAEGLQVVRRIDSLNAVRLRVRDADEARRIRELAGDDASFDYNYIVATPSFPQPSVSGQPATPFDNRALEWLGVPRNNQNWGEGVTVAVLDTGVGSHFVLDGKAVERMSLVEPGSASSDSEFNGHGTAVASLLVGEDGLGIAPAAKLLSIQVMDSNGIGDSFTLAEGIVEAVDAGASVISMSLGSYGYTRVLENAVNYALSQEVALVASVGNEGSNVVPYPAQFEGVIGVAAVDLENQRAAFSNYSPAVDIAAPGVGVFAAWDAAQWVSFSGTSAAAPYVSGSIAANLSLNPNLSPSQAADLLFLYADDGGAPGPDVELGNGTLNLDRVLNRDEPNLYDAAVGDFYLDLSQATEAAVPLLVTVQNRGTERLNSVSVEITQNDGIPQKVYLGSLLQNETTAHTLYLDPSQLTTESGYSIEATTLLPDHVDARTENNAKSGRLQLPPETP